MNANLECPFCHKEVGLAGMFVAHIIGCGHTEITALKARNEKLEMVAILARQSWSRQSKQIQQALTALEESC